MILYSLLLVLVWFSNQASPCSSLGPTLGMDHAASSPSPPAKQVHHEPISFGIDQILGAGTDSESGRTSGGRQNPSDLNSGEGYYSLGSPTGSSAPSYAALSISLSGIMPPGESGGPYGETRNLGTRGVIRVPAHRPMPPTGPPAPVQSVVSGFGGLCFPWIGNRFSKDRLSGNAECLSSHSAHKPSKQYLNEDCIGQESVESYSN